MHLRVLNKYHKVTFFVKYQSFKRVLKYLGRIASRSIANHFELVTFDLMTVYSVSLGKEYLAAQIMFSTVKNMLTPIGESVGYTTRRYMNQIFLERGYRSAKRIAYIGILLIIIVSIVSVEGFYLLKIAVID